MEFKDSPPTTTHNDVFSTRSAPVHIPTERDEALVMGDRRQKSEKGPRNIQQNRILRNITTISLASTLLFTLLIVYLCISDEFVFFTWHPLLVSTGWMFLMSQAISVLSNNNILTGTLPRPLQMKLHWILQIEGLFLVAAGFTIVYINKNYKHNGSHFTTWHGYFGLVSVITAGITTLGGVLAFYSQSLKYYVQPKYLKILHVFGGILTYTLGSVTLITSIYTKWFERKTGDNDYVFVIAFILVNVAVWWTLLPPIRNLYDKLRAFIS